MKNMTLVRAIIIIYDYMVSAFLSGTSAWHFIPAILTIPFVSSTSIVLTVGMVWVWSAAKE